MSHISDHESVSLREGGRNHPVAVEAYPASANAYDSLSEVLEAVGQPAAAAEWAGKGLTALTGDTPLPPAQRKTLEDGLRPRVARLKGKQAA